MTAAWQHEWQQHASAKRQNADTYINTTLYCRDEMRDAPRSSRYRTLLLTSLVALPRCVCARLARHVSTVVCVPMRNDLLG